VRCKRIVDFYLKPLDNIEAPVSIGEKFTVFRKTIYLEGICGYAKKSVNKKGCFLREW
jgi:Fe2+ or Zn2+ uptake regulation protein